MRDARESTFWIRVRDEDTRKTLYEYRSVFADIDEAVEDVRRMIEEGRLIDVADEGEEWKVVRPAGYLIELFDTHPGAPGVRLVGRRTLR